MGRTLQIRVIAQTFDEKEVEKRWPRLTHFGFPANRPATMPRGVLELARSLSEQLRFGADWSEQLKTDLKPGIQKACDLCDEIEACLADWKAREANQASDNLEETLDDLEKIAPKP